MPPKPQRLPPFVMASRHEMLPQFDVDWTLHHDWDIEMKRRQERNVLIKEQLQCGSPVCYHSSGWSLYPRVHSGDCCTFQPVNSVDQVQEDDIVFCEVQPGDRFYGHLVKRKEWNAKLEKWVFTISNMKGRENGWCYMEHIYGRLTECVH